MESQNNQLVTILFGTGKGSGASVMMLVIGLTGAIVMPSFMLSDELPLTSEDMDLGIQTKIKILNNNDDKSAMGTVSDTFRKLPDVLTGEGIFRVSAWGKEADAHALSGFQKTIDSGGYASLLGVDIYKLSAMHYVEDSLPDAIKNKFKPSEEVNVCF